MFGILWRKPLTIDIVCGAKCLVFFKVSIIKYINHNAVHKNFENTEALLYNLINSPHKWPITRKMFPFSDVIMWRNAYIETTDITRSYCTEYKPLWWYRIVQIMFDHNSQKMLLMSYDGTCNGSNSLLMLYSTVTNLISIFFFTKTTPLSFKDNIAWRHSDWI